MSRPLYLLDTNIISELAKPFPNSKVVENINKHKHLCAIPTTTLNELLYGLHLMPESKSKDYLFKFITDEIQSTFPIIDYDSHCAWIQSDLRACLKTEGTTLEFQDTQIASIAIANQMILVTRNTKHFQFIQQVSSVFYFENWFEE